MKINLLNTHLESMGEHRKIRISQLNECFNLISAWNNQNEFVVFGGDLNIRDEEVKNLVI